MRRVEQRGENDCGIACLATLANVTYATAKSLLPPRCSENGTTSGRLIAALKKAGIVAAARKPIAGRDYTGFTFDAALIGKLDEDDDLHWAVWDAKRKKLIDPYPEEWDFRCTSFVRIVRRP